MWRIVGSLVLVGCGRIGFAPGGDARPDAGDDALAALDAFDAIGCTWKTFSPPTQVPSPVQSGFDEWSAQTFLGETRLMFHRYATTNSDFFLASRATTAEPFGNVVAVDELNNASNQWTPAVSDDGLTVVYAEIGAGFDLHEASRVAVGDPFLSPLPLTELNTSGSEYSPWLSSDGLRLTFTAESGNSPRLFETTRADRESMFASPVLLELGGTARDPTLSPDGLELFFASDRAGGTGMYDVWTARRTAPDQPFGAAVHVPELSSARDDIALRLSRDGRTIYFNYDTLIAGGGAADIWMATRECL